LKIELHRLQKQPVLGADFFNEYGPILKVVAVVTVFSLGLYFGLPFLKSFFATKIIPTSYDGQFSNRFLDMATNIEFRHYFTEPEVIFIILPNHPMMTFSNFLQIVESGGLGLL
jgi:hypothetical protein